MQAKQQQRKDHRRRGERTTYWGCGVWADISMDNVWSHSPAASACSCSEQPQKPSLGPASAQDLNTDWVDGQWVQKRPQWWCKGYACLLREHWCHAEPPVLWLEGCGDAALWAQSLWVLVVGGRWPAPGGVFQLLMSEKFAVSGHPF